MKRKFLFTISLTLSLWSISNTGLHAQGVAINATGAAADTSAIFDVSSFTKGLLIPRMSIFSRDAIPSPAKGLMILQNDIVPGLYYNSGNATSPSWTMIGVPKGTATGDMLTWDGTAWVTTAPAVPAGITVGDMLYWNGSAWVQVPAGVNDQFLTIRGGVPTWVSTNTLAIGMSYGGGIIAYILQPGDPGYSASVTHGLIVAPTDQSTGIQWGCFGTTTGATGSVLGTGQPNTTTIVSACGTGTAAYICNSLTLGGFSDWYLPSSDELGKLFNNRAVIGGFGSNRYWSSTEAGDNLAYYYDLSVAPFSPFSVIDKYVSSIHTRAFRSF